VPALTQTDWPGVAVASAASSETKAFAQLVPLLAPTALDLTKMGCQQESANGKELLHDVGRLTLNNSLIECSNIAGFMETQCR
jgi:hypothetical protein